MLTADQLSLVGPLSKMTIWQTHLPPTINPALKDWLTDRESMTTRLKSTCNKFSVDLIKEYVDRTDQVQCDLLAITKNEQVKFREVYLCCDNKPMLFAESLFPQSTLDKINALDTLKNKPIGEVLFADTSTKRGPIEFKKLNLDDDLYKKASQKIIIEQDTLWARRSVFTIQNRHLLIAEVFLF